MNFADSLKRIQACSGWTQTELAAQLGVSFATVNSWINERSKPRARRKNQIAQLLAHICGTGSLDADYHAMILEKAAGLNWDINATVSDRTAYEQLLTKFTYHTNAIEGSTMTLADVEGLLLHDTLLANRTLAEQTEARNHRAAFEWMVSESMNETFQIDSDFICGLHLRLMTSLISDAGRYRNHPVRIAKSKTVTVNPLSVPRKLDALLTAQVEPITIKGLARFHAEFEQIHPFSDGNGRVGRLLMFAQASAANLFPPLVQNERSSAYYTYLEMAQVKGDYSFLETFIAESMIAARELLGAS